MILTNQQITTVVNPNISTFKLKLSSDEISGDRTATPKITCPALSKILETLSNCFLVSIGFFVLNQLFILVYDSLEFIEVSSRGDYINEI